MLKLGSRFLITAVLLAATLTLGGSEAGAQQRDPALDLPAGNGGIVPLGVPDSGEPDIGQTREKPGGNGGTASGSEYFQLVEVRQSSVVVRWLTVMWTLRYLGLGS